MVSNLQRKERQVVNTTLSIINDMLGDYRPRDFEIRLWNGLTLPSETGLPPRFTLVLQHPGSLRKMLLHSTEVALGEAYIYDDFDIEGDFESSFVLEEHLRKHLTDWKKRVRLVTHLLQLPNEMRPRLGRHAAKQHGALHSKERDRQAVAYHYDVSNDFYALWLDEQMVYTCAYFASHEDDLATAQRRKLDYVCRKLRLRPGERLLDIGCGWGALIMHAAREYGVQAVGVTLSSQQAELAHQRIQRAGLEHCCRAELCDYRDVDESTGFDKLASVGMFEQIGESHLPEYFAKAWRLLRPGGVFLNHGISRSPTRMLQRRSPFVTRYVFPDGDLVPLSTTLTIAEQVGFEIRDVENLREHYALTLRHWVRRLEACHDEVRRLTNEVTYRVWRLYMATTIAGFEVGRFNLDQVLLGKPHEGKSGLPLTRADWYHEADQMHTLHVHSLESASRA